MSSTIVSAGSADKQSLLPIFVHSELDDFGLDPYEFRVYARIARRAGNGNAFESIKNIAVGCRMSEGKVKMSLRLLIDRRLVKRISRPGTTTVYQLTLITDWVKSVSVDVTDEPRSCDVHPTNEVDIEQPRSSGVHHPGHHMSGGGHQTTHHPGRVMSTKVIQEITPPTSSLEVGGVEETISPSVTEPPEERASPTDLTLEQRIEYLRSRKVIIGECWEGQTRLIVIDGTPMTLSRFMERLVENFLPIASSTISPGLLACRARVAAIKQRIKI